MVVRPYIYKRVADRGMAKYVLAVVLAIAFAAPASAWLKKAEDKAKQTEIRRFPNINGRVRHAGSSNIARSRRIAIHIGIPETTPRIGARTLAAATSPQVTQGATLRGRYVPPLNPLSLSKVISC